MWNNLLSNTKTIAEKAKEQVKQLEGSLNESVGAREGEFDLVSPSTSRAVGSILKNVTSGGVTLGGDVENGVVGGGGSGNGGDSERRHYRQPLVKGEGGGRTITDFLPRIIDELILTLTREGKGHGICLL